MRYLDDTPGASVPVDSQERKQTVGKRLPSELVAWDAYAECALYGRSVPLELALVAFRRGKFEHCSLDDIGKTLIETLIKDGFCPEASLEKVYDIGAKKYSPNGWKQGVLTSALSLAGWRHLSDRLGGEKINTKDGDAPHLAHALWQVLAIKWMQEHMPEFNDLV